MNDLRIKYTKPSFTELSQIDTDLILITMSGGNSSTVPDPFSNKGASSDSDDNSGNGEGFEYNPFR